MAAPSLGRFTSLVRRIVLRTGETPLRPVWAFAYRRTAGAIAAYLSRACAGAAVYTKGALTGGHSVYGLSDIDLIVVAAEGDEQGLEAARQRWQRLSARLAPLAGLVPHLWLYRQDCLVDCLRATYLTYGLDERDRLPPRAALLGSRPPADEMGLLERPGLESPREDWVSLTGPERRPIARPLDVQERRIRAWLELQEWWRYAYKACSEPTSVHTPYLCVKLVAEPARILLWLDGEAAGGDRVSVLERARRRLPEEEQVFRRAIELHRSLPRSPDPPLADALAALTRLSGMIASRLSTAAADVATTAVRVEGGDACLAALPGESGNEREGLVPLADWRACAVPAGPDEVLARRDGNPADPGELTRAIADARSWRHPALRRGDILVLPTSEPWWWGRLRAVQCPPTDPVSFALLDGSTIAHFPELAGWSALDCARRAVAEHWAWLRAPQAPDARPPGWIGAAPDSAGVSTRALGMLFTAARAALFLQSVESGESALAATVGGTAQLLGSELALEAHDTYVSSRRGSARIEAPLVHAFRELVCDLPPFRLLR